MQSANPGAEMLTMAMFLGVRDQKKEDVIRSWFHIEARELEYKLVGLWEEIYYSPSTVELVKLKRCIEGSGTQSTTPRRCVSSPLQASQLP